MANVTSSLDIVLRNDVSGPAIDIAASFLKMEANAKGLDEALAKSTFSTQFSSRMKAMGASVSHVDAATKSMEKHLAAYGTESKALKNWESVTLSSTKAVIGAERALEQAQLKRASAIETANRRVMTSNQEMVRHTDQTLRGIVALYAAHNVAHLAGRVAETYRDFDKERRYGKVVMGLNDAQQAPLIQQAIRGGATTKFNDIQWLESQRELASRGYKIDQVMAFAPVAAKIGQAFDKTMPEGVKALEGAMLGFGKDVSTFDKALASANRTADLQVKASKISGMDYDDMVQLYKFGASPARMAHLSEESMLAFGGIAKKANMGGDESGTAFRALTKNLLSPTAEARTAMMAAGIDFGKFQVAPHSMNTAGFVSEVARKYGVTLDARTQAGLGGIFSNPALLADASKFTPAVTSYLRGALGGKDAKSLKSIAGLARSYRDDSVGGVDTNGLLAALMAAMAKNPALANSVFGSKQGGRIFAALGDPKLFGHMMDELTNHSQGFAQKVSDERMAGFDGAMSKLEGSIKNLESAIGRAFDDGGKGGFLTTVTNTAGQLTQALAEANPKILQMGSAAVAVTAAYAGLKSLGWLKGGFGLNASATALDEAAFELKGAAAAIAGRGLPGDYHGKGPGRSPSGANLKPRAAAMVPSFFGIGMDAFNDMTGSAEDRAGWLERQGANADATEAWWNEKLGALGGYLFGKRPAKGGGPALSPGVTNFDGNALRRNDEMPLGRHAAITLEELGQSAIVLKASFEGLAGTLAGLQPGGGGGGGGIINASYESGGFGGGGGGGGSSGGGGHAPRNLRYGPGGRSHSGGASIHVGGFRGSAVARAAAAGVGGRAGGVNPVLLAMIHRASEISGLPLSIVSGYRSPEQNRATGGAQHSLHMRGFASDLTSPGHGKWDPAFWTRIDRAMGQAAGEMHQPYRWGGRFIYHGRPDWNHFDLTGHGPSAAAAAVLRRGTHPATAPIHRIPGAIQAMNGGVTPNVDTRHLERTAAILDHIHHRMASINAMSGGPAKPGSFRMAMNRSHAFNGWERTA